MWVTFLLLKQLRRNIPIQDSKQSKLGHNTLSKMIE